MRSLRIAFVFIMLALASLPGLQMLFHAIPELAVDEQRRLAPPPDPRHPAAMLRMANAWFSDHFGLRPWLIHLKTEADLRVFGFSDKVYVGRDGYLFYRDLLDQSRPEVDALLATQGAHIRANIARYAAALRAAHIRMVLDMNPIGDRLMPEKLPPLIAMRPALPHYQRFEDALLNLPDIDVIDSGAIIRHTMQKRPVFQRTDFHWNDPGAFPVMQRIVDDISRAEGRPASLWQHGLQIETRTFSGGVARFMPVFQPPSEQSLFVVQNWSWPTGFRVTENVPPLQWETQVIPPQPNLLPPVFVIGDSYMNPLLPTGFPAYFNAVYRKGWQLDTTLTEVTAAIPPDTRWLVMEFIEIGKRPLQDFADDADVDRAIALIRQRGP